MKNQILGEWENSKSKYVFNDNTYKFYDKEESSDKYFIDYYGLSDNTISFYNDDIVFKQKILSISETVLIIEEKYNNNLILFKSSSKNLNQYLELHKWVRAFLETEDRQPAFKDYWKYLVEENQGDINVWNKEMFEEKSLLWETSLLGNSNWKEIWDANYIDLDKMASDILSYSIIEMQKIEEAGKIKSDELLLNSSIQNSTLNKNEEIKSTFLIYLFERFSFVFLIYFFSKWILTLDKQIDSFFGISDYSKMYYPIIIILGIILFGLFNICSFLLFFLTLAIRENKVEDCIKKISFKNILLVIGGSFFLLIPFILTNQLKYEKENKKCTIPFLIFSIFLIFFIKGSPLINNYTGVVVSFEVPYSGTNGMPDGENTTNIPTYVYDKKYEDLIQHKIKKTIKEIDDTEDDGYESYEDTKYEDLGYDISTRNYLFEQTAFIEGFKSENGRHKGFVDYISCLIFFAIEKLIVTIIWFLIPFLTWVGIATYRNKT